MGTAIDNLCCWKCGQPLTDTLQPFPRAEQCPKCSVDLHVCLMCVFYDKGVAHACREPVADEVKDKSRSNFCGYFTPSATSYRAGDGSAASAAKARLNALFDTGIDHQSAAGADVLSAGQRARNELDDLFGVGGKK